MSDRIQLRGLYIHAGERPLVRDVGLSLEAGEILALVGSSGSGKTLTARALLGLAGPRPGVTAAQLEIGDNGRLVEPYEGLAAAVEAGRPGRFWRRAAKRFLPIRGRVIGYMAQDARGALDPMWTVQRQVQEALELGAGPERPHQVLERAGFRHPHQVLPLYPHQLSGGMAQRACIALALARGSRFLIADEPTTGLDPTVQEAILAELQRLAAEGIGVLLITHDLRIVPRVADRVQIMHAGETVACMPSSELHGSSSPQVRALVQATARVAGGAL